MIIDEGSVSTSIHPPKCIPHLFIPFAATICISCSAFPQTALRSQGSASEYDHSTRQSWSCTGKMWKSCIPRTWVVLCTFRVYLLAVIRIVNILPIDVLPLVYNALESEHAIVQERALKIVPDLCETIDYAEVQSVLFPRVAVCPSSSSSQFLSCLKLRCLWYADFFLQLVFTKTRILSVKVNTLVCFLSMVKTLDQVRPLRQFVQYIKT